MYYVYSMDTQKEHYVNIFSLRILYLGVLLLWTYALKTLRFASDRCTECGGELEQYSSKIAYCSTCDIRI